MVADWLQKLLILQDRDTRCDSIRRQLEDIPTEIKKEEVAIGKLKEALTEKESELKGLEVRRLDLEGEVAQAEDHIVKYKTQQMQVKKNEEFTALENEIKSLQSSISDLEDDELQILEEIEIQQSELDNLKQSTKEQKHTLEAHINLLKENYASFESELKAAEDAVKACQEEVDDSVLQQYHYVKGQVKRPPVVVQLEDGRCQGCHLKVSGDIESTARRGKELVRCDSCGRILYFDR
jgi:predicted  nucleic acid-binding Zn-ribbon protein